jgi:glycosyltransferase involved in cell wall biosynthesis
MPGAKVWLSVIMPIRNGAPFLGAALDSVVREGCDGVEIIVVDDGSTDASLSILARYRDRLSIRVLEHRTGSWVAGANLGLRDSDASFACILHQDDLWLPGRLAAIRAALDAASGGTMVLHHAVFVDSSGGRRGDWLCPLPAGDVPRSLALSRLLVQNFIAIPSPVFPRQLVLDTGGMDESLWYSADWDLWLRLANLCRIRFIPHAYSAFRVHESAQTVTKSSNLEEMAMQLETVRQRHLPRLDASPCVLAEVEAAGRFSNALNLSLMGIAHGNHRSLIPLAKDFLALGPRGWRRYVRDSRILERVRARYFFFHRLHDRSPR